MCMGQHCCISKCLWEWWWSTSICLCLQLLTFLHTWQNFPTLLSFFWPYQTIYQNWAYFIKDINVKPLSTFSESHRFPDAAWPNYSHFGLGRISGLSYTDYYNTYGSLFGALVILLVSLIPWASCQGFDSQWWHFILFAIHDDWGISVALLGDEKLSATTELSF